MKFLFSLTLVVVIALSLIVLPKPALAFCSIAPITDQAACESSGGNWTPDAGPTGTPNSSPTGTPNVGSSGPIVLDNPIGISDPRVIIGNVIKTVLGIVGSLALILFIYGGLMMMTSAGNTDRVSKGRDTLVWASIGLMVIFASYTIVAFLLSKITQR